MLLFLLSSIFGSSLGILIASLFVTSGKGDNNV